MRNFVVLALGLLLFGAFGISQAAKGKNSDVEQKLMSMEKQMWEAWKNHDIAPFKQNMTDDVVLVGRDGIMQGKDKLADMMTKTPCDVKSYSLEDMKVNWVDKDAALLTYKVDVDATCGGQKAPSGYDSSLWVKKNGKWLTASHQGSPAAAPAQ
jgi:uncharacterized protein (TIGR02246 family)